MLVCCTGGEEGDLNNSALAEPGQPFHGLDADAAKQLLATLRPHELAESARIIGFSAVEMLGYRDSGMAGEPTNDAPDCFARADEAEAAVRLAGILTDERADVLVIYDDHGGYGHPDHIQVHRVGVRAAELAGTPHVYEATIDRDHLIDVIRKTARKMSTRALEAVALIPLGDAEQQLLADALG